MAAEVLLYIYGDASAFFFKDLKQSLAVLPPPKPKGSLEGCIVTHSHKVLQRT